MLHAIVMAGGAGTRFWPASRVGLPKQLLPLAGERSLLEDTVERLDGLVPPERVLIVTSARLLDAARRHRRCQHPGDSVGDSPDAGQRPRPGHHPGAVLLPLPPGG